MSDDRDHDPFQCARLTAIMYRDQDPAVDHRAITARVQQLAAALPLPSPWDVPTFIDQLADVRGRPIELRPVAVLHTDSPCGALVSLRDRDVIGYVSSTPLHEEHIVLHEAAHLVCGHADTRLVDSPMVAELVPDLPRDLIESVLGRSVYDATAEAEAELLASLYLYRAGRAPAPLRRMPRLTGGDHRILSNLHSTFDDRPRRPEKS